MIRMTDQSAWDEFHKRFNISEEEISISAKVIMMVERLREQGIIVKKILLPVTMNIVIGMDNVDGYEFYGIALGLTDNKNPELLIEVRM